MHTLNSVFDKIIWIGSEHRPDRAEQMTAQLKKFGITAEHFEAHWKPIDHTGKPSGNFGCTSSHRGVLELICHNRWQRTLILEDDATFVDDSWPEQFDALIEEVPIDWCFLFLGCGYAEPPIKRVSEGIIRSGALLTTSSYAITFEMARRIAPHIYGIGPIDNLMHEWQRKYPCYVFNPRIMVQRPSFSDLQDRMSDNSVSMLDRKHEEMV
jgi:GR25 family glycosyltransferase involved in LPS biosynthesis